MPHFFSDSTYSGNHLFLEQRTTVKHIAAATACALALTLAGCASTGTTTPESTRTSAKPKTILSKDVKLMPLEDAMAILDAGQIEYEVRIQGPGEKMLPDPKAASEKGKWKALMLMGTQDVLAEDELKAGDAVRILVRPLNETASPTPTPTPTAPSTRTITYTVTADGPILTTTFGNMIRGRQSQEQANDVISPFTKEYVFTETELGSQGFNSFSVYAQAGEGTSTISCEIKSNGNPLTKNTSTGPYAVVMCTS